MGRIIASAVIAVSMLVGCGGSPAGPDYSTADPTEPRRKEARPAEKPEQVADTPAQQQEVSQEDIRPQNAPREQAQAQWQPPTLEQLQPVFDAFHKAALDKEMYVVTEGDTTRVTVLIPMPAAYQSSVYFSVVNAPTAPAGFVYPPCDNCPSRGREIIRKLSNGRTYAYLIATPSVNSTGHVEIRVSLDYLYRDSAGRTRKGGDQHLILEVPVTRQ